MEQHRTDRSGLFVGFEGFRSPTEEDLSAAVKHALVVLDTNVLLNLYSFQGQVLSDFIRVFAALKDRLFVPHQAMDEFWRNRRTVLAENQGRNREQAAIEKSFDEITAAFKKWHQRVVDRTEPPSAAAVGEIDRAKSAVLDFMQEQTEKADVVLPDTPTHQDRVLTELEPLLDNRVGPPPTKEQLRSLRAEGKERISGKVPPGYMDGDKNSDRAIGDFLVWKQTIEMARERQLPVLMVTQDQKEDWWADRGTRSMRARPELVAELLAETGQRLLMIRAHDLVRLGPEVGVEVSQSTLEEVVATAEVDDGWDAEVVTRYLETLAAWPGHLQVLEEAVEQEGIITRQRMAEVLGRDEETAMRGVGRPYSTALRRIVDEELVDPDTEVPFFAYYEDGGWMSHFVMYEDLIPLFSSVIGDKNAVT
jgi:hypothetical protein